jgi:glycosyltransferase involved in cell wall biosynthesis
LKKFPKISIVTPSFNQGNFIEQTILSIIKQDYPNLEYIIIDGGSTDNTLDVIKKYEKYLKYWVSEPDNGQSHALNKGFSIATGEIYAYINSDDCLYPGTLLEVAKAFNNSRIKKNLLFVGDSHVGIDYSNNISGHIFSPYPGPYDVEKFVQGYGMFPQPSCFWTKTNLTFSTFFNFAMDHDFWIQLLESNYKVIILKKTLSFYRVHDSAKGAVKTHEMWADLLLLQIRYLAYSSNSGDFLFISKAFSYKFREFYISMVKKNSFNWSFMKFIRFYKFLFFNFPSVINYRFIKFTVGFYLKSRKK